MALGICGIIRTARRLAGMLDADEHRALVGSHEHARHLADARAHEKTPYFASVRVRACEVSLSEWLLTKSSSTLAMAGVLVGKFCELMRRPGAGRAWRDARGALFRFDEETLTVLC